LLLRKRPQRASILNTAGPRFRIQPGGGPWLAGAQLLDRTLAALSEPTPRRLIARLGSPPSLAPARSVWWGDGSVAPQRSTPRDTVYCSYYPGPRQPRIARLYSMSPVMLLAGSSAVRVTIIEGAKLDPV
jgi:hypothetical protein